MELFFKFSVEKVESDLQFMVNFVTSSARLMFITFVILYLIQVRSVVGCLGESYMKRLR